MGWLSALLGFALKLFGVFLKAKPDVMVSEGEKAGAAQAAVAGLGKVQQAVAAGEKAEAVADHAAGGVAPDGVRPDIDVGDPFQRD